MKKEFRLKKEKDFNLVFNKGKIVEKMNFGYSDNDSKKKVTNDTVFRIASVSKILVALCIMRLYEEGKLDLYGDYELKNVRYKKMRKWIAISPKFTSIHFNSTYPGKRTSPDEFEKTVRQLVEGVVAAHAGLPDKWRRAQYADAGRDYLYGYGEFHDDNIYVNVVGAEQTEESILAYDTGIKCACGCGEILTGSGEADDGYRYQGSGFTHDCMVQYYWCDLADDWCNETDGCGSHCRGCSNWDRNHPTCELNSNIECPDVPSDFWDYTDWDVTEVQAEESHCKGCPHWEACHPEEDEDDCCED